MFFKLLILCVTSGRGFSRAPSAPQDSPSLSLSSLFLFVCFVFVLLVRRLGIHYVDPKPSGVSQGWRAGLGRMLLWLMSCSFVVVGCYGFVCCPSRWSIRSVSCPCLCPSFRAVRAFVVASLCWLLLSRVALPPAPLPSRPALPVLLLRCFASCCAVLCCRLATGLRSVHPFSSLSRRPY